MQEWLTGLAGEGFAAAAIWIIAALILLAVVLVILRIVRNLGSGTLVAGKRNRAPRLAVVDAAAVDNQRRLVLVRRDDVEHLILIGGPSDIVVEQHIRTAFAGNVTTARPAGRPEPSAPPVPPRPPESVQARPRPVPAGAGQRQVPPISQPERPVVSPEPPVQRDAPITPPPVEVAEDMRARPEPTRQAPAVRQEPTQTTHPPADEIDTSFPAPVEPSMDEPRFPAPAGEPARQQGDASIEEEMSRLLDDLSDERKKES